VMESEYQSSTI